MTNAHFYFIPYLTAQLQNFLSVIAKNYLKNLFSQCLDWLISKFPLGISGFPSMPAVPGPLTPSLDLYPGTEVSSH